MYGIYVTNAKSGYFPARFLGAAKVVSDRKRETETDTMTVTQRPRQREKERESEGDRERERFEKIL